MGYRLEIEATGKACVIEHLAWLGAMTRRHPIAALMSFIRTLDLPYLAKAQRA
jgi:hypothetical protein